MKKTIVILLLVAVGLLGVIAIGSLKKENGEPILQFGGGTTPYNYEFVSPDTAVGKTLKTQFGTLGSVTITGTGASMTFYNATTTNVNLRANATSSLPKIADFPASLGVGTYLLDIGFNDGLVFERGGATGTSTIAWD